MPDPSLKKIADHNNRIDGQARRRAKRAFLYQLTFPNGMIYIGCTTKDPLLRVYGHKNTHIGRKINNKYSAVTYALNKFNEVTIKTLVIGELAYALRMETAAIKRFSASNELLGYNKRVAGGRRIGGKRQHKVSEINTIKASTLL